jgi:ABC-type transport system involved in multi-copper enzyme maturation permease subunit
VRELTSGIHTVFVRELGACLDTPIAPIVGAVFLVLSTTIFMNDFFLRGVVDMSAYFAALPLLLIPFIPAITMRLWAEERAQNTFELLLTLPLDALQVILGKYLAALCFYLLILAGSLPIVVMLVVLGTPDGGAIVASYLGAALLGAFFLAFGQLASALTRDQVVAFVLGTLIGFVFVVTGHETVVEVLDGIDPGAGLGTWLRESISVLPRYETFTSGLVTLADVVYFALMIALFLALNRAVVERSRR